MLASVLVKIKKDGFISPAVKVYVYMGNNPKLFPKIMEQLSSSHDFLTTFQDANISMYCGNPQHNGQSTTFYHATYHSSFDC
uniref:Uncharacterized protein n=1 Tax=Anguilla anguilla TaxID=7936 RepID=A0A0E9PYE8_ANGAN